MIRGAEFWCFPGGTLWNPWQRGFVSLHTPLGCRCSDHPPGPFLKGRGKKIVEAGGTPSIPLAREVAPLWTPRLHVLGDTRWNPWQRGFVLLHAPLGGRCSNHPPGPLPSRKGEENSGSWRDILQTSCQRGCTPLDSPLTRAGGHPLEPVAQRLRLAARSVKRQVFGPSPWPLPERKGEKIVEAGGTPSRPPAREVAPLWTPRLHVLGDTLWNPWQRGFVSLHAPLGGRCSDHPPGPLPERKGGRK